MVAFVDVLTDVLILDLLSILNHRLLQAHDSGILFIGNQLEQSLPISALLSGGRRDALRREAINNLAQAVTMEASNENPAHDLGLGAVDDPVTVFVLGVAITYTVCQLGGALTE